MSAKVSQQAPDFSAEGLFGDEVKKVSLSDYSGKWLVLFFYPLDFSSVCPTEITSLDMSYDKFIETGTEILSISVDSVHSHRAWKKEIGNIRFGMLSDITKEISRNYGVLLENEGIALRGTFIIDPSGKLRAALVNETAIGRNINEILRLLQACQTGDACPADWKPGQKTLGNK